MVSVPRSERKGCRICIHHHTCTTCTIYSSSMLLLFDFNNEKKVKGVVLTCSSLFRLEKEKSKAQKHEAEKT